MPYNSDNFDLSHWKITLPEAGDGSKHAKEVENLENYEHDDYFYVADDGAMVFRIPTDGITTKGSKYPRSELREMDGNGEKVYWQLEDSDSHTMTATLTVDEVPVRDKGVDGRVIVGQIHGADKEPIRLYYDRENIYFNNDQSGADNSENRFYLENENGERPQIALGEKFSYQITATKETLTVKLYHNGEEYTSVTPMNEVWLSDHFYFKAGLYSGVNDDNGHGEAQVSFYGLDLSHDGGGFGGLDPSLMPTPELLVIEETTPLIDEVNEAPALTAPETAPEAEELIINTGLKTVVEHYEAKSPAIDPTPVAAKTFTVTTDTEEILIPEELTKPYEPIKLQGTSGHDILFGDAGNNALTGRDGNDMMRGNDGDDELYGNNGDDTIIGGLGADILKGGKGSDVYRFESLAEHGDTILGFRNQYDKIDLEAIFDGVEGFNSDTAIADGYIRLVQNGKNVDVHVKTQAETEGVLLVTLSGTDLHSIYLDDFILPATNIEPTPSVDILVPSEESINLLPIIDTASVTHILPAVSSKGTNDHDILSGGQHNDLITALDGNDIIHGGAGDDELYGNKGNDTIIGGLGADTLKGSSGTDIFVYQSIEDAGDTIVDFRNDEKLNISELAATLTGAEDLGISELIAQGYLAFSQSGDRMVHVYVDTDGNLGETGGIELVTLHTKADFEPSEDMFII